ncbi:DUF3352 domain-containing protein [Nocardioidaceae bacterium]|nr:DUF3352 domain-containing protein [Nocardioidaceae bacterium]
MSTYEGPADEAAPTDRGTGRRTAFLVAGALALVLVGGAVALGLRFLGGGGTQPAAVVPDDAIAYVGIDFDPPAGQKIEAYRFLRAFPDLRERAPEDQEDLRQFLIELALDEAPECDLTWADDFEPWLGDRAAIVLRPGEEEPQVLGTVQVTDEQGARETAAALDACGSGAGAEPTGIAFADGYAILAETQAIADGAVAAAGQRSLEDLAEFDEITALSGQDGIVEAWFGNGVVEEFLKLAGSDLPEGEEDFFTDLYDGDLSGAFTLRFAEGGLEAVAAFRSDQPSTGAPAETIRLEDFPADTAVGFTAGVSENYEQFLTEQLDLFADFTGDPRLVERFERQSGLSLPEDVLTLVGDEFGLAVREDVVSTFFEQDVPFSEGSASQPPSLSLPVALLTSSDEAAVSDVLDALRPLIAPLELSTASGALGTAYGPDADWNAAVADPQDRLGDLEAFQAVLPELDGTDGALFVNFNGGIADDIRGSLSGRDVQEFDDIVGPLSGLGVSISTEGDAQVARVRLGTD